MKYTVPIITLEEFRHLVIDHLVFGMKDYTSQEMCDSFIGEGVVKFSGDNLGSFVKSLCGKVYLPTVCVNINDSMFYWMVCGTDAILVKKTVDNTQTNGRV